MDHRTPISSREAKIIWLLAHPTLWESARPEDDQNWRQIIKLMKVDGLIARTTYPLDVNVPSLIAEAELQEPQLQSPPSVGYSSNSLRRFSS